MAVNKAILRGYVGQQPDVKKTADDRSIVTISLATTKKWTDRNSGEKKEKTTWHRLVFFDGLAKVAEKYIKKGSNIYIEGEINNRDYTDDKGVKKYISQIDVRELDLIATPNDETSNTFNKNKDQKNNKDTYEDFDDDIPF